MIKVACAQSAINTTHAQTAIMTTLLLFWVVGVPEADDVPDEAEVVAVVDSGARDVCHSDSGSNWSSVYLGRKA